MLKELIGYSNNIKEEVKVTLSKILKNPQGTNSEGKEGRIQLNDLEYKEEIINKSRQKQEFKKTKGLGSHGTTLNIPMSES